MDKRSKDNSLFRRINPNGNELSVEQGSFSGVDINAYIINNDDNASILRAAARDKNITTEKYNQVLEKVSKDIKLEQFGSIQTISISIASSIGPVRRLGEKEVVQYKVGARTVGGTLIFAVLNKDVFSDYMRDKITSKEKRAWRSPNYVDEIPEFNIVINGGNEYGSTASGLLIGVRLVNFGTTLSVDDLYIESTYTYVARHYIPFTDDWRIDLFTNLANESTDIALSAIAPLQSRVLSYDGTESVISAELKSRIETLPENVQRNIINRIDRITRFGEGF